MELTVEEMRISFRENDLKRDEGLVTPDDIKRYDHLSYGEHGVWNQFDIYHLRSAASSQPVIISIHGGGWVYGDKELYQYYCMNLAQRGFCVVNFNYRLAPEHPYPAGLTDINSLFTWVAEHGTEYFMDLDHVFVVGDSAGAQLASQYLAILTNVEFQKFFDFRVPNISVKGVALNCGMYDAASFLPQFADGIVKDYLGTDREEKIPSMDTMRYVTADFPPAWITTAYHDFLKECGEPMCLALKARGIKACFTLYGDESQKEIAHVFHLNIKSEIAQKCNDETCEFFASIIKKPME